MKYCAFFPVLALSAEEEWCKTYCWENSRSLKQFRGCLGDGCGMLFRDRAGRFGKRGGGTRDGVREGAQDETNTKDITTQQNAKDIAAYAVGDNTEPHVPLSDNRAHSKEYTKLTRLLSKQKQKDILYRFIRLLIKSHRHL